MPRQPIAMRAPLGASLFFLLTTLNGCLGAGLAGPAPAVSAEAAAREALLFVAYGDSYTAALDAEAGRDRPEVSWATGVVAGLQSIHQRLLPSFPDPASFNAARSGYRAAHLPEEVAASPGRAQLVAVFIGINDLCTADVSLDGFVATTRAGFEAVAAHHPQGRIVVFGIPDLGRLHRLHLQEPAAVAFWSGLAYCRGFFSPGLDPLQPVRAELRRGEFNRVLETEALARGFAYSDAFEWPGWTLADFSERDYFHPNVAGAAKMAAAAWPDLAPRPRP